MYFLAFAVRVFPKVLSPIAAQSQHGWSYLVMMSKSKSSNWPRRALHHHRSVSCIQTLSIPLAVYFALDSTCFWLHFKVLSMSKLGRRSVKLFVIIISLFLHRCHPPRLPRSRPGPIRDWQQSVANLEEERPRPRASWRFVLFDQESCGHPQALGAQPQGSWC